MMLSHKHHWLVEERPVAGAFRARCRDCPATRRFPVLLYGTGKTLVQVETTDWDGIPQGRGLQVA